MPKYQISTPGGFEVEVRADTQDEAVAKAKKNWQTMPRIIAKEGKTRVFERSNGQRYVVSPGASFTDPDKVDKVLKGMTAGEVTSQGIDEDIIAAHPVAARGQEFLRGFSGGSFLDEAYGKLGGEDAQSASRMLSGAMQRQRPGQTLALNLGGGATEAAMLLGRAPNAVTRLGSKIIGSGTRLSRGARAAGAGAALGATEGAIYGAGEGTNAEERAASAATGAQGGAMVGGGLGALGPLARAGAENVIGLFRRSDVQQVAREFGISQPAARVIKNAFEMGESVDDANARLERAGAEGIVGDAGEAAQSLLDATAASGPAGSAAVKRPLEARATRSAMKLDEGLTDVLGEAAEGPQTAITGIQRASQPARKRAYDEAFAEPINYAAPEGRKIEDVLDRVDPNTLEAAIEEANAEMRSLNIKNQQIMKSIQPDGEVVITNPPNVIQLNQLKRALDKAGREARSEFTDTQQSLRFKRLAGELRDALVDATGGEEGPYARALRTGGDTIQEREAFELGEDLLSPRTRVEDVRLTLGKNPSQAQVQAAKTGLRTRIEQVVGDVRRIPSDPNIDARQMLATLREMGSDNARTKIRRLMGDEADEVLRLLDEASVAAETRAATSVNSRTAIRQATGKNVQDITAPGAAGTAARGDPINASQRIIQAVTGMTDEFTATQQQKIYQDIARALTEKQGPEAVAALRLLEQARYGQQLTDAQTRQLSQLLAASLYGGTVGGLTRGYTNENRPR